MLIARHNLFKLLILFGWTLFTLAACEKKTKQEHQTEDLLQTRNPIALRFTNQKGPYRWGDTILIEAAQLSPSIKIKHAALIFNDSTFYTADSLPFSLSLPTPWFAQVGEHTIKLQAIAVDGTTHTTNATLMVLSDKAPQRLHYQVIHTLPHNTNSYTQGLEFDGNTLYEGTGLEGRSKLKKIDFFTGKTLHEVSLAPHLFGEGITVFHNKIYQLTWQNGICLVYDKISLEKITELSYNGEGWGLTHYNDLLVRSNGTNKLFFHHPDDFRLIKTLQVYDDKRAVMHLNELEMVGDVLYANIYTEDIIAKIDIHTGKVLAYIDLENILPESEQTDDTDVLNGIAWHPIEKRLYVTGKNWPKLFAIKEVATAPVN